MVWHSAGRRAPPTKFDERRIRGSKASSGSVPGWCSVFFRRQRVLFWTSPCLRRARAAERRARRYAGDAGSPSRDDWHCPRASRSACPQRCRCRWPSWSGAPRLRAQSEPPYINSSTPASAGCRLRWARRWLLAGRRSGPAGTYSCRYQSTRSGHGSVATIRRPCSLQRPRPAWQCRGRLSWSEHGTRGHSSNLDGKPDAPTSPVPSPWPASLRRPWFEADGSYS